MTGLIGGTSNIIKSALRVAWGELRDVRPKVHAVRFLSELLPLNTGSATRVKLMQSIGCTVGHGTTVADTPKITGVKGQRAANLRIGCNCAINVGCEFEIASAVTIGDNVTIGHQTLLLTTTHELGPRKRRAGPPISNPIVIEDGVSIGPRCVILPGVTIGAGAIVDSCSVVSTNVTPNTRVAGVPARHVETLAP